MGAQSGKDLLIKLDMTGAGCPPGTFVSLDGEYVDDRLDYCLSISPSSSRSLTIP